MRGREDVAAWAVSEFGAADLGDHPGASLPDACADPATLKAAYRCFDTDAITPDAMLTSHVQATYARLAAVPVVLAVNDTTLLDWTHHPATANLGPLASRRQQGVLVHSTLTFTPERAPLGRLGQDVRARDPATSGRLADQHDRPIDEQERVTWRHSLAAITAAAAACPATRFVQVGDADADVYDLFVAARAANVDVLVRAGQDRRVEQADRSLRAAVRRAPLASEVEVALSRQGERPARRATLAVRFRAVTLRPPGTRAGEQLPAAALWAVWAEEVGGPPGAEPVAWLLLTTCPVTSAAEAEERLLWYACRWGIEVWHKVLKSGCQIEARQLASRDRLARALPALPCTALLEADEWQALWCAIHRSPTPPARPPTLQEAVRWLGRLGGHPGRTRDGEPGVTVLWKGFQHLADLATMYRIMKPSMHKEEVGKG